MDGLIFVVSYRMKPVLAHILVKIRGKKEPRKSVVVVGIGVGLEDIFKKNNVPGKA